MKTLIYYMTKTGYTKEYVDLLERRLVDAEVYHIKKIKKSQLKEADCIFFGGPLRNNVILGLNKFLKKYKSMKDKNIFVFAVGARAFSDPDAKENIINANGLSNYHVRLYILPGCMDLKKQGFMQRTAFKIYLKSLKKKEPGTYATIMQTFEHPISYVRTENLDRMVEVYHKVKLRRV